MSTLQYDFAPTPNGVGFNNPVSSRFRGRFSHNLVRESIQNALDQHDISKKEPVKVKFSLFTIPARKIPDVNRLARIFKSCMN